MRKLAIILIFILFFALPSFSAEYFDNNGKFLREFAPKPINLAPLASHRFSIKESDEAGGFGANFIVKWKTTKKINRQLSKV